jgi:hypothetical protein
MESRPDPRFFKLIGRNTVNVPFNFYNNSGRKLTLDDLENPTIQPYTNKGLEVMIKKIRPNVYKVEELENQNNLENKNVNVTEITNVSDPNLLAGPRKLVFKLPPNLQGGSLRKSRHRKSKKTRRMKKTRKSTCN